jgi:predicted HNH restriction endonuclease
MLDMVPLCRSCHRAIHDGDVGKIEQLRVSGTLYHNYLRDLGVT